MQSTSSDLIIWLNAEPYKQAATKGGCSEGLADHLKRRKDNTNSYSAYSLQLLHFKLCEFVQLILRKYVRKLQAWILWDPLKSANARLISRV